MSITLKYEPKRFADLVFTDASALNTCHRYAFANPSKSLMLWGPPGSGKTTTAQVIVQERFLSVGYGGAIEEFNGADVTSKDFEKFLNIASFLIGQGVQPILIINELDEMDRDEQAKLRSWMDRWKWIKIIATTNENPALQKVRGRIMPALCSRFECVHIEPPTLAVWLPRAGQIFAAEGHPQSADDLRGLLGTFSGDVRDMLPIIEEVLDGPNAITFAPISVTPTLRVIRGQDQS